MQINYVSDNFRTVRVSVVFNVAFPPPWMEVIYKQVTLRLGFIHVAECSRTG